MKVKESSPFAMTFTVGYSNVNGAYFPDGQAADGTYANYEAQLSSFLFPDTTNAMIAYWEEALNRLYQNAQ